MENEYQGGTSISGYRNLTQDEIDKINGIKRVGNVLGEMIEMLRQTPGLDQRWVSIAQTDLQKGIMAAVRSVAQPTTF